MNLSESADGGLYETMCRIRAFEAGVRQAVLDGEVPGSSHLYIGQEAVAAGVCSVLEDRDRIISNYRGHGHAVARGVDTRALMAEVFGKVDGVCGGRVGSLHLSCPEKGILAAPAIVGGGLPVSVGVAYAQLQQKTGGVTVVFFGDGASDHGTVHEAMNLAALWKLPIVFVVENNGVAYFTPQEKHQAVEDISVRASAYGMPGLTVDGTDAGAVAAVAREAVEHCRNGLGPMLLEFKTYRFEGHFVGDACPYRDAAVTRRWMEERDPVELMRSELLRQGADEGALHAVEESAAREIRKALEFARTSPEPDRDTLPDVTYANWPAFVPEDVKSCEEGAELSFSKAVRQALESEMRVDESVFVAGEDISWGGTVKLAYGLAEKFPGRVLDTPISETAIAGLGLGAAMMGMRPVIDLNLMDFTLCALDEIVNEIAKYRFMSAGKLEIPLVIHVSSGAMAGAGPQHCQSLESLYTHVPGLKVVVASTPADGAGLMRAALRDPDPVVFIDCVSTSGLKGPVPEGDYLVPLGRARVARAGNDATVLTYGSVVDAALEAAEELSRDGVSVEVVDLRSLVPLDMEAVAASVAKTGHVVIAHEAVRQGGFGAEVAARIAEECFESLRAPVVRLGAPFEPVPFAPALKQRYYVGASDIARAVSELVDTRG